MALKWFALVFHNAIDTITGTLTCHALTFQARKMPLYSRMWKPNSVIRSFRGDCNASCGQQASTGTWLPKGAPWSCWKHRGGRWNLTKCHSHGRRAILQMEVLYGYIKYIWMWVQVLYMPYSAYSKAEIIIFYPVITHAVIWREMLRRLSQVFRISSNSLGAFETNLLLKK